MILALASTLALVFGIAVAGKLGTAGADGFRSAVGRLWFGPGELSRAARKRLAGVLVAGEVLVTVGLVGGAVLAATAQPAWAAPGFAGAAAMLATFTAAQATALARRRAVPCACFGRTAAVVGPVGLLRTAVLLVLAVIGLAAAVASTSRVDPTTALVTVPAGLLVGLLLVHAEDLVALFRPADGAARAGA